MTDEVKMMQQQAEEGRSLYRMGEIQVDEAKEMVMPYLNAVNKRAKELAVKFGMKPKKVNFYSFVR